MTGAGEVLAREIARQGPITFYRFMEIALYHPEHGYYRRMRDPFGKTIPNSANKPRSWFAWAVRA